MAISFAAADRQQQNEQQNLQSKKWIVNTTKRQMENELVQTKKNRVIATECDSSVCGDHTCADCLYSDLAAKQLYYIICLFVENLIVCYVAGVEAYRKIAPLL